MATWITHLMIADSVLEQIPHLNRQGFCVGSIAPDCNVENQDWTQFVPSREITHWMSAKRKDATDSERFYNEYVASRRDVNCTKHELSFLLGYYAHLVADAEYQRYIRDPARVAAAWDRIKKHPILSVTAKDMAGNWDSIKKLITKAERAKDIEAIEAEYLDEHPHSGYLTEILKLQTFPDYMDYLPHGAIVRKIRVMGYLPQKESSSFPFVAMSRAEYATFLETATKQVVQGITHKRGRV